MARSGAPHTALQPGTNFAYLRRLHAPPPGEPVAPGADAALAHAFAGVKTEFADLDGGRRAQPLGNATNRVQARARGATIAQVLLQKANAPTPPPSPAAVQVSDFGFVASGDGDGDDDETIRPTRRERASPPARQLFASGTDGEVRDARSEAVEGLPERPPSRCGFWEDDEDEEGSEEAGVPPRRGVDRRRR